MDKDRALRAIVAVGRKLEAGDEEFLLALEGLIGEIEVPLGSSTVGIGRIRRMVDGLRVLNIELGRQRSYVGAKASLKSLDCSITPGAEEHLCSVSLDPTRRSVEVVFVPREQLFKAGWLNSSAEWESLLSEAASKGLRPANQEEILAIAEQLGDQDRLEVIWIPSRDALGTIRIFRIAKSNRLHRRIMYSKNWSNVGFRSLVVLIRNERPSA